MHYMCLGRQQPSERGISAVLGCSAKAKDLPQKKGTQKGKEGGGKTITLMVTCMHSYVKKFL